MPSKKSSSCANPPLTEPESRRRFRAALGRWFRVEGRDLPWRRTTDAYAILVSEMMLQQTQVATVIPYYERWLSRFPTIATLAAAEEAEVLGVWQGLGYYARARNLHRAARAVMERHAGALPREVPALEALPGIGRYTAGAIASFAHDQAVAAVDANIGRVLARLFDIHEAIDTEEGKAAVWEAADALLPTRGGRAHNSALMELGALVCTARAPKCGACPVHGFCATKDPERLPVKRPRRATVRLLEVCSWVRSSRGVLLERQDGSRWKGLWKLPRLAAAPAEAELLWEGVYPFTHHRVTLQVYAQPAPAAVAEGQRWMAMEELEAVGVAAAHRRAITALLGES